MASLETAGLASAIVRPSNRTVQSLWIGEQLTAMEQLSIASFLRCGHEFHLYTYGPVAGMPRGTTRRDAAEILPASSVFGYHSGFGKGSVAVFSDFFRYKLLLERGGWWVDTDVVCQRPLDFAEECILGTERLEPQSETLIVSSAMIRQSAGSALMCWMWDQCQQADKADLQWGEVGPRLMQRGVDALGLHAQARPPKSFSPIPYFEWESFIDPIRQVSIADDTYAVHLWRQMWTQGGVDPDAAFPDTCLYQQWRRRMTREAG